MITPTSSTKSVTQTYIQGIIDQTKSEALKKPQELDSFVPSGKYGEYLKAIEDLKNAPDDLYGLENYAKCSKIAHSIMKGDKVSMKDKMFLMKYAPDLYMRALLLALINEKPSNKKQEDISGDEETKEEGIVSAVHGSYATAENSTGQSSGDAGGDSGGEVAITEGE